MPRQSFGKTPSDCGVQCRECGATLARRADMNRHRKALHPDGTETKFSCPLPGCGYVSAQKSNVKCHFYARHSGGPMYPCPNCPRRFTDNATRIRHRKKLHGYVPYHTMEYHARQAVKEKEKVVQKASKAVSNTSPLLPDSEQVLPNASPSVPPPAPKLPETACHDDVWKMPVDATPHLYSPQLLSSQYSPLSLPFETWPGCYTPNTIQNFPSAAPSPLSITPSDFTIDNFSGLLDPQFYATQPQSYITQPQSYTTQPQFFTPQPQVPQLDTTQSLGQQFEESLAGDHSIHQGMSRYNENGQWNWQWPL